jgi:putative ABC transport system permease protein
MDIHSHVKYVVVGVAKDIHFSSLHDAIRPIIYQLVQQNLYRVSIKAVPGQMDAAYTHVESVWRDQFPDEVRKVAFLDDYFDEMYLDERRQAQVFGTFAGLAIFVASLGLFGLASFTTERRTKEIGIRKVMGASVSNIVILLTREFNILVVIANILAWPAAYYLMSAWLTRFVFPAPFGPSLFVGAAFAAFLIAWITVASLAGKAAMSHPIQALRYE